MKSDPWLDWYCGKEGEVEDEVHELTKIFAANKVMRILDLGCGTGRHLLWFAKKGFSLWRLDQSKAALARAEKLLEQNALTTNLLDWDMTLTPYPYKDSFFDAVIAIRSIHHTTMANIRRIVAEITRLTRLGGYLHLNSPTYERALRLRAKGFRSEEVEPGTFLPREGEERGILHHHFAKEELFELLSAWKILDLRVRDEHYCLTAVRYE